MFTNIYVVAILLSLLITSPCDDFSVKQRYVVPPMASGRIQHWVLTLSSYEYDLKYRKGAAVMDCPESVLIPGDVLLLSEQLSSSSVTACEIKTMTSKDPVSKVLHFVLYGSPITTVSEETTGGGRS